MIKEEFISLMRKYCEIVGYDRKGLKNIFKSLNKERKQVFIVRMEKAVKTYTVQKRERDNTIKLGNEMYKEIRGTL